jgi:hypothetical protein
MEEAGRVKRHTKHVCVFKDKAGGGKDPAVQVLDAQARKNTKSIQGSRGKQPSGLEPESCIYAS